MQSSAGLSQRSWPLALVKALSLTAATQLITCIVLGPLDNSLLLQAEKVLILPVDNFKADYQPVTIVLSTLLIQLPLVFAVYQAAIKTRGAVKCMITFQICVLAFFSQWLVWTQLGLGTSPLSIILGIVCGFIWGQFDRQNAVRIQETAKNELVLSIKDNDLKAAHLQLVKQDEADRRILASDLHDQVLNDLKTLRQATDALRQAADQDVRLEKISAIEKMIDQTTAQVREVMENLTPSVLENLGLASALDDLLRRSGSRGKFKVRFKNEAGDCLSKLSKIEALLIFRTVQEALTNTIKHAQATRAEVLLAEQKGELIISIVDDGLGMPQEKQRGQSRGLRYMRQRADLMGANIAWLPGREQKGCLVEIKLLLKEV